MLSNCFPHWLHHFTFPLTIKEAYFSAHSPTFVIFNFLFQNSHPNACVVLAHGAFHLHSILLIIQSLEQVRLFLWNHSSSPWSTKPCEWMWSLFPDKSQSHSAGIPPCNCHNRIVQRQRDCIGTVGRQTSGSRRALCSPSGLYEGFLFFSFTFSFSFNIVTSEGCHLVQTTQFTHLTCEDGRNRCSNSWSLDKGDRCRACCFWWKSWWLGPDSKTSKWSPW